MERILLALLLSSVWFASVMMDKVLPFVSASGIVIFLILIYSFLLTAAQVHQKRKSIKRPKPVDSSYLPKVSVLVPAHNEELVIEGTVSTLMALDYPNFDLLVVDDRSTDGTPQILAKLSRQYGDRFRYHVRAAGSLSGKSAVLNEALDMVDGEVICVFDADAYVEPDFLKNIVPFLADEGVGGVQARKVIANYKHNLLTRCQNYEYSMDAYFQCGRDSIHGAVELRGNGQLVKREALESVGGWNNFSLTDDLDLSTRLHLAGWDIRFAHKVVVWEEGIVHFMPLLRQRRRWAEGSLTRYLEYAGKLLTSNKISLRTTADMIAYFVEFLVPLWVVCDYAVLGLDILTGNVSRNQIISSFFLLPVVVTFFSFSLVVAIIRFNKPKLHEALWGAVLTGSYITYVWTPVVFWVMLKILCQKERSMNWGKTEHFEGAAKQAVAVSTPE